MKRLALFLVLIVAVAVPLASEGTRPWETWQPPTVTLPTPNAYDTYLKAFALKKEIDARVLPPVKEQEPTKAGPPDVDREQTKSGRPKSSPSRPAPPPPGVPEPTKGDRPPRGGARAVLPPPPPSPQMEGPGGPGGAPSGSPGPPPPGGPGGPPGPSAPERRIPPLRQWPSPIPAGWLGEGPPDMPLPQVLALYDGVLKLVREGLAEKCRIPLPAGFEPLPIFGDFRSAERLLTVEAAVRHMNGDNLGAANSALDGLILAQHAMSQRTIISYLVGIACEAIALQGSLEETIPWLTAPECRTVLERLLTLEHSRMPLSAVMAGAKISRLRWFKALKTDRGLWLKVVQRDPQGARLKTALDKLDAATWHGIIKTYGAWERYARMPYLRRVPPPKILDSLLIGDVATLTDRLALRQADALNRMRQRELQLAVRAYLLEKGQLPQDLAALVPNYLSRVPADPFGDGPMKSLMTPDGLAVYSIGPDGVDDNGTPTERNYADWNSKGDIVFVIGPRP